MEPDNGTAVQAAVRAVIAERDAGPVLHALYHRAPTAADGDLDPLSGLVPTEQISSLRLVERLALPDLASVIVLLATLHALRTQRSVGALRLVQISHLTHRGGRDRGEIAGDHSFPARAGGD